MKKRNAYVAMVFSFISASAFYSGIDHNVVVGSICLILTYFISINYGMESEEGEENEQAIGFINRTRPRNEEEGA